MIKLRELQALSAGDKLILSNNLATVQMNSGFEPGDTVVVITTASHALGKKCVRCAKVAGGPSRWFTEHRFNKVLDTRDWYDIWLPTGS